MRFFVALLLVATACDSDPGVCGESGERVGAVCSYAVVEGGFRCPVDFPLEFQFPGGGRICAPLGTEVGDLPLAACRFLGRDDCSEARRPGLTDASTDVTLPVDGGSSDSGSSDSGSFDSGSFDAGEMCVASGIEEAAAPSPFGSFTVDSFFTGDCITITGATVGGATETGERVTIEFGYPVETMGPEGGRVVTGTFTREARFRSGGETRVVEVEVEVTRWIERRGDPEGHEIDIAIRSEDPSLDGEAIVVRGRFCDWALLLC
ncbi:MAG: hypothetical protein AAGE52_37350 [Myxococcota bacterium]